MQIIENQWKLMEIDEKLMKINENQRRRRKGEEEKEEEEEVPQFYISQLPIDLLCGCYW